jgi:hypothetical protein
MSLGNNPQNADHSYRNMVFSKNLIANKNQILIHLTACLRLERAIGCL